MLASIFTEIVPIASGRANGWYRVRPLTMEDVIFTDWKTYAKKSPNETPYDTNPTLFCSMKINPELLVVTSDKEQYVTDFIRRFGKDSKYVSFEMKISYVGIRKCDQWKKFNEAIDALNGISEVQREVRKTDALAKLNSEIKEDAHLNCSNYIENAKAYWSKIAAYDLETLNKESGCLEEMNKKKEFFLQIDLLDKAIHSKREKVLREYWNDKDLNILPYEVQEIVKDHVLRNGFAKPSMFPRLSR